MIGVWSTYLALHSSRSKVNVAGKLAKYDFITETFHFRSKMWNGFSDSDNAIHLRFLN